MLHAYCNIERMLGTIETYETNELAGFLSGKVSNPKAGSSKIDNTLWSFYSIIQTPELTDTGTRRCSNNCDKIYALCLDYDGGAALEGVHNKHKEYEHYIYSSFRHLADNMTEKFRMILPLEAPVSCDLFRSSAVKKYLNSIFIGCDESTFSVSRTFYMPMYDVNNPSKYVFKINDGIKYALDVNEMARIVEQEKKEIELVKSSHTDESDLTGLIKFQQNKVMSAPKGNKNNQYWKSVWCLSQHGMTGSEIYHELICYIDGDMRDVFINMCNRI